MKQLPVGIQDFKMVRDKDYYFVDKSMLIGQILSMNDLGVYSITRPRRFGKSLNLSMLDAFFNIKYKGNTWFDGLEISKHPEYDRYKNAFPVVAFSLKAEFSDFDGFIIQIKQKIYEVFGQFVYILDSPKLTDRDRDLFNKLYYGLGSKEELMNAFANLCALLEKYHGTKVVVLIDEYDASINNIKDDELRGKILSFIGGMLSPLLKEGTFKQLGVVTGIMQITKENIFSGLNNIIENDIFDTEFDEMFGFTNNEVKQICADYGHPEKFEEAKEWYDGYRFGDADIYNPWSILNYINRNFKPGLYWVNSGKITAVTDIISNANRDITEDLKALGSGESVQCDIVRKLIFKNLKNPKSIYSLLTVSGYLKAIPHGDNYLLSIPNRELLNMFSGMTESIESSD